MSERRRILYLVLILITTALMVGGVSIYLLYGAGIAEEQARLVETAQSQARLIEAMARHTAGYHTGNPETAEALLLDQIRDSHEQYEGFGETGEFVLARLEGDQIVFLLKHRHGEQGLPPVIPFDSNLAAPMRRSLLGETGTMIGLDYRGQTVLSAYEPVRGLGWGIVTKIDLQEIQETFIRAALIAVGVAVVFVSLGAYLFFRLTSPLLSELEENEIRFRSTFEQAAVGLCHVDINGSFLRVNQRFCDILGYTAAELLQKTFQDITHPDDLSLDLAYVRQALVGEIETYSIEKRYIHKQGFVVLANLTSSMKRDSRGEVEYAIAVVEDISERKAAEVALIESEARYAHLAQNLPGVIYQYLQLKNTAFGELLFVSPQIKSLYGIEPEEARRNQKHMAFMIDPTDVQGFQESLRRAGASGEAWSYEWRVTIPSGEEKWLKSIAQPVPQPDGNLLWDGLMLDITAQKRAEATIRQQDTQFRMLIETSPLPIAILNQDQETVYVNQQFERLFGYTGEHIPAREVWRMAAYPDEDSRRKMITLWEEVVASAADHDQISRSVEVQIFCKDSTQKTVLLNISTLGEDILLIFTDLTDRKIMEESLRAGEERYRSLVENTSDLIYTLDSAYRHTAVNPALCNALGRSEAEILSRDDAELGFPPEQVAEWFAKYRQVMDSGRTIQFETEAVFPHAGAVAYDVVLVPIHDAAGNVVGIRGVSRDISEKRIAEAQTRRQLERISALHNIDMAISSSLDLDFTLGVILNQVVSQLQVDAAAVFIFDSDMQVLNSVARRGFHGTLPHDVQIRLGSSLAGKAALERKVVRVNDLSVEAPHEVMPLVVGEEHFVAYVCVPLIAKGEVKGVLEIFHRSPLDVDEEWNAFLDVFARQAAIAMDNAALFGNLQMMNTELKLAYETTLEGWAAALELRDQYPEAHTSRLTEMTLQLAAVMGINEQEMVHIQRGAMLHDIGKVGIPDSILCKPGPLTPAEREEMEKHAILARKLLSKIPFLQKALDIPYSHHERWDGSGYPHGLKAEQIPLAARIFAVVNVWGALTSDRPYRKAWAPEKALEYLGEQGGKLFDPQVVEAFLHIYKVR